MVEERMRLLIAVGASVSANCPACLKQHADKALGLGVDEREISEAIEVGRKIRAGAASRVDRFAATLDQLVPMAESSQSKCGCGS